MEGGNVRGVWKKIKINKRVSTFIREMRVPIIPFFLMGIEMLLQNYILPIVTRKSQEKREVRWLPKKYINVAINNTDCLAVFCGLYSVFFWHVL